jgi:RNA polymerase sigma factor (TIGR02999 family)
MDSSEMSAKHAGTVSQLLQAWGRGDLQAREDLVPLVYQELRKQAAAYLRRERRDHTLQPTALVHEAYLRLMGQQRVAWVNRAQFFGLAGRIRDHSRRR